MGFSYEDKVLITNLYLIKCYGARKLMSEFTEKNWKKSKLLRKLRDMGTVVRKKGSGRPKMARTAQNVSTVEELAMSQENQRNTHGNVASILSPLFTDEVNNVWGFG